MDFAHRGSSNVVNVRAAPLEEQVDHDPVNHPKHYTSHPSGVECVDVAEHYDFNVGNAIKYLWRAGLKSESPVEDLRKAPGT